MMVHFPKPTELDMLLGENLRLRRVLWALIRKAGGTVELTMTDAFEARENPELIFHPATPEHPLKVIVEAILVAQAAAADTAR